MKRNSKRIVTLPHVGHITMIFNSTLAERLAFGKGADYYNVGVTPNGHEIHALRDFMDNVMLAHECGHILQARKLGLLYLPWVFGCYGTAGLQHAPSVLATSWRTPKQAALQIIEKGYRLSKPEQLANQFMNAHAHEFPSVRDDGTALRFY